MDLTISCIDLAKNMYEQRADIDTNPMIAQMLDIRGEPFSHWYYRSNQYIYNPLSMLHRGRPRFIGPTNEAGIHYTQGTYRDQTESILSEFK